MSERAPLRWLAQRVRGGVRPSRRRIRFYAAGFALLVAGIAVFGGPAVRVARNYFTRSLRTAADAGIEIGRSALNDTPTLFPDSGYVTLQADQAVNDGGGDPIPNVTRSIYFGPTGSSTGRSGVVASVVSVITGRSGPVVVRRGELAQESFARYANFTNSQGFGICFGGGDQIFGPMYANGDMCIYSSGARFHNTVEVTGTIAGINYGTFDAGYIQHGVAIPMPTVADLSKLSTFATQSGMSFTAPAGGTSTQARLRIEFLALDLDGDGRVTGPDEGFFRVYQDSGVPQADYVTGTAPATATRSRNCGDAHTVDGATTFFSAAYHLNSANPLPAGSITHSSTRSTAATQALQQPDSRCYLAGDEHLTVVSGRNTFGAADSLGFWMRYTDTPAPAVIAGLKNAASGTVDTSLAARTLEAQYLWPLSRRYNPSFQGVIYVNGRVVVSGVVHARVTLAASDNVIVADDLRYATPPGSVACSGADMLGLLSAGSIFVADNVLNTPQPWFPSGAYHTYAGTSDEFVQGVLLAFTSFKVENYGTGSTTAEPCGATPWGRGCLNLTGGIIQGTRGAVGTTGGTGYVKRNAYNQCALEAPPPHFPTTGRFSGDRNYGDIDPVGFDVASFFRAHAPR